MVLLHQRAARAGRSVPAEEGALDDRPGPDLRRRPDQRGLLLRLLPGRRPLSPAEIALPGLRRLGEQGHPRELLGDAADELAELALHQLRQLPLRPAEVPPALLELLRGHLEHVPFEYR